MKTKIPITGFMTLESDESQWLLLLRGLVNELRVTAIVEKEPGLKGRINLIIKKIISPDMVVSRHMISTKSSFGQELSSGLTKTWEFLSKYLDKNCWMFIGFIEGAENVPVLITFYKSVNLAIYSQKINGDNGNFFPELN